MKPYDKKILFGLLWWVLCLIQLLKFYIILSSGIKSVDHILYISIIEFSIFSSILLSKYKSDIILRQLFLFVIFFYFYNHIYPLVYFLIIDISIFSWFRDVDIYRALIFSTITFSALSHLAILESKSITIKNRFEEIKVRNHDLLVNIQHFPLRKKMFFFLYALFSIMALYYAINYFSLSPQIKDNRMLVLKTLWAGPGIYIKIVLVGVSGFCFVYLLNSIKNISFKKIIYTIIILSPFFLFWTAHTLAGNRRETISFFIFILTYLILLNKITFRKIILFGSSIFIIVTLMSKARGSSDQDTSSLYLNSFGEFIMPYNTLVETMRKPRALEEFKIGETYLYPIYAIIPRAIWKDKPLTTASQFSIEMDAGFGLGYSPLTEAYTNFGVLAILSLPLLILCLYLFFLYFDKKFPFLFLFLIINVLNLNRGELGTVLLEIFIMYVPFILLYHYSQSKTNSAVL